MEKERALSPQKTSALALMVALGLATAALAHPPAAAPATSATVNMQGNDAKAWAADPHIHAFYDTTVAAFAKGADKVDFPAYEQKSFAIFRDFGASKGMAPQAMQDHLKLIPHQVLGIVKGDPKVLDSYDNFILAVMGPD